MIFSHWLHYVRTIQQTLRRNGLLIGVMMAATLIPSLQAAELSQYTAVRVQKAHQLAQDERFDEAIELLKSLELSKSYDQAFVARMLGIFYWQNEQSQLAITQLERAVKSGAFDQVQGWQTQKMLADILLNEQQFERALPYYYQLVKAVPATEKASTLWLRVAQSEFQLKSWKNVLNAMTKFESFEANPEMAPLSIKLAAQLELQQWRGAISTIKRLIALEPNRPEWWRQLVAMELQINEERAALDSLALAKLQGVELSDNDLTLLAQLYAKRGIPEKAAEILGELSRASQDSRWLAQQATYWQLAKEWDRAIGFWRQAASQDASYHWPLAQLLVQEGHYQQALAALEQVKGRDAEVALASTRAYYKLNRIENALHQAKRANAIEPSLQAQGWIRYLTQLRKARHLHS